MRRVSCILMVLALSACGNGKNEQPTPSDVNNVVQYEKQAPGEAGHAGDPEPNRTGCIMQCKAQEQAFYLECMKAHFNHKSAEKHCKDAAAAATSTCEADTCS